MTDLKLNNEDPKDPVLASEFTSTSLCAGTAPTQSWVMGQNPHAKYNEFRYRGYMRAEVTPTLWRTDAMAAETLMRPGAPSRVLRSFVIEDGRPGPELD